MSARVVKPSRTEQLAIVKIIAYCGSASVFGGLGRPVRQSGAKARRQMTCEMLLVSSMRRIGLAVRRSETRSASGRPEKI